MKTHYVTPTLPGIANHLISEGLLSADSAINVTKLAEEEGIHFLTYLVKKNLVSPKKILESCANTFNLPIFDFSNFDFENTKLLNTELIKRYQIIPLKKIDQTIYVGISDPTNRLALDTISFATGLSVSPYLIAEDQLQQIIESILMQGTKQDYLEISLLNHLALEEKNNVVQEKVVEYDEPLIRFVNHIIQTGFDKSASDIHVEPFAHICRIRYRLDGILYEMTEIPIHLSQRLATRLKVMASLDITERRLPQDGRILFNHRNIRLNICPTLFGEKIVLRLIDGQHRSLNIDELGFNQQQKKLFLEKVSNPQGLILVTGPTGSGKTETLYTALNHLNTNEKNISTIEDPVEIQLNGINQVNVNSKMGLNFANVLRAFLRQDPDIIMVGEIRDTETAEIAIQAAQTGHLVLSTLHTNSAIETLSRLLSMGIPSYNLISSVSLIIAQRLVRKLCQQCKIIDSLSVHELKHHHSYKAVGCPACLKGYLNRTAIFELLPMTDTLASLILNNAAIHKIKEQAKKEGFFNLQEHALEKVTTGITTLLETYRVLST